MTGQEGSDVRQACRLRLVVELVPATSFARNLRTLLPPGQWDQLRRIVYRRAGYRCEVCGGQGLTRRVEAHERWAYDDATHVQRLACLVALCPACHGVVHIGHSRREGRDKEARRHLREVNGWTGAQVAAHISKAMGQWERRSRHAWTLDLDHLRDYGIEPPGEPDAAVGEQLRSF